MDEGGSYGPPLIKLVIQGHCLTYPAPDSRSTFRYHYTLRPAAGPSSVTRYWTRYGDLLC